MPGLPFKYIVYSYLLALVTAINNGEMYFNKLGALFEDVIALLSKFPGAVLSHVARSENLAAHGLAKHALRLDDELSLVRGGSNRWRSAKCQNS
uniref:RNase H type-1 domain-containing protein n=1 Tax=Cannabis sativa TaxID=3483 RepID=A0A803QU41_CANSA